MWEWEKMLTTNIFSISRMFLSLTMLEIIILSTSNLLSTNGLSLVRSKMYLFGKALMTNLPLCSTKAQFVLKLNQLPDDKF